MQFIPSIFDPLGLLNPVIVKLKILFQDASYEKFAWDDDLPQSYLSVIYNIVNGLREEQKVLFERVYCIQTIEDLVVSIQFHAFCDASERAYGCCCYLRFLLKSDFVALVSATQIELLDSLLSSRLMSSFAWKDSSIATHGYRILTKFITLSYNPNPID